jgi:hypothetical protein
MNLAAVGLSAAVAVGVASGVAALVVPVRGRPGIVETGTALTGAAGMVAGIAALRGQTVSLRCRGCCRWPVSGSRSTRWAGCSSR